MNTRTPACASAQVPLDVLSGEPKAPLYIGFPSQVWVISRYMDCDDDYEGDESDFRLFVDEESARHMLRSYILEAYQRDDTIPDECLESVAQQAQQDWVEGKGTQVHIEACGYTTKIIAQREDVWTATATGCKTVALSRRDALGALGR